MRKKHKKTEFTFASVKDFDSHIVKSIPGYNELNRIIVGLADYFLTDGSVYYDIGSSSGHLIDLIDSSYHDRQFEAVGIEYEPRFTSVLEDHGRVKYAKVDVTQGFDFVNASMVTSIFTLQFLDRKDRLKILKKVFRDLNPGGLLVLGEKLYSRSAEMQEVLTFLFYDFKSDNFTDQEILEKEIDLRRMMHPMTYKSLEDMLYSVGFSQVEIVWKNYNFAGIVAIKEV